MCNLFHFFRSYIKATVYALISSLTALHLETNKGEKKSLSSAARRQMECTKHVVRDYAMETGEALSCLSVM